MCRGKDHPVAAGFRSGARGFAEFRVLLQIARAGASRGIFSPRACARPSPRLSGANLSVRGLMLYAAAVPRNNGGEECSIPETEKHMRWTSSVRQVVIYIYIYIERERDRHLTYIYIYIYIHLGAAYNINLRS